MTQGIFTHEAGYNNGAAAARVASKRGLAAACVCSCLLKSTSVFTLTDCRAGDERGENMKRRRWRFFYCPPTVFFLLNASSIVRYSLLIPIPSPSLSWCTLPPSCEVMTCKDYDVFHRFLPTLPLPISLDIYERIATIIPWWATHPQYRRDDGCAVHVVTSCLDLHSYMSVQWRHFRVFFFLQTDIIIVNPLFPSLIWFLPYSSISPNCLAKIRELYKQTICSRCSQSQKNFIAMSFESGGNARVLNSGLTTTGFPTDRSVTVGQNDRQTIDNFQREWFSVPSWAV